MSDELFDGRYKMHHGIAHVTNGGGIYAARHEYTQQLCAIKLLDADVRPIVRKRAMREMDALARAQGPGIVEFRDAGELVTSGGKQIYIVMELLEGRTLGGLLAAKGRLEIGDAITIVSRISEVLVRCHSIGIVHRDIKPLNVYVSPTGDVHLLDLGIAKILDPQESLEKLTQENTLLGTPEYMAPEALLASPDADHRVDQYALGVTMYECLTGVVPYEGAYAEVTKKMSRSKMTPLTDLRPDVPEALATWVARALQRNPDARFSTMLEMHDALVVLNPNATFSMSGTEREARAAATIADSPVAKRPDRRRRHPRAPFASLARITRSDQTTINGRVEEISESGCQFVASESATSGDTVTVRFALPISGRLVDFPSVCRWSRATRVAMACGFEFTALPPDALTEIRKYVMLMGGE